MARRAPATIWLHDRRLHGVQDNLDCRRDRVPTGGGAGALADVGVRISPLVERRGDADGEERRRRYMRQALAAAAFGSLLPPACGTLPLWVKVAHTLFVAVLVPVYWRRYGPGNFLWFSDLALFGALAALWLESPLLASMQAVSVSLLE